MASYIGVSPPEQTGIVERYKYTGDGSATAFSGADTNAKVLRYTSTNPILVFLNGVQLVEGTDFTKTSNTVVTFAAAPANNDEIEILTFGSFNLNSPATIRCDLGLNTTDSPTFNGLTTTGNVSINDNNICFGDASKGLKSFTRHGSNDTIMCNSHLHASYGVWARGPNRNNGMDAPSGCNLCLYSDSAPRLMISSAGNVFVCNDLTVDTNTLHVDATNNRVGIGTSSPTQKLTIADTSVAQIHIHSALPSVRFSSDTGGGNDATRSFVGMATGSNNFVNGSAANDFVVRGTSGNKLLFGGGSSVYGCFNNAGHFQVDLTTFNVDATNNRVGIGTVTPTQALTIAGGNNAKLAFTGGGVQSLYFNDSDTSLAGYFHYQHSIDQFRMNTSGSIALTGGNVGIGTTSPDNMLHIAGSSSLPPRIKFTSDQFSAASCITADNGQLQFHADKDNAQGNSKIGFHVDNSERGCFLSDGSFNVASSIHASNFKQGGTDFTDSILLGTSTTGTLSSATCNVGVGVLALQSITSGCENVVMGHKTGHCVTTGKQNTFIGHHSGCLTSTGFQNTAIGTRAMASNTTGNRNIAVGYRALAANVCCADNTVIGHQALEQAPQAKSHIAIGNSVMRSADAGSVYNIGIGGNALCGNTTGSFNVAIGNGSMFSATTASNNIAIGYNSLYHGTTFRDNFALGSCTMCCVTGSYNVAIGNSIMRTASTSEKNIGIGYNVLNAATTAARDTAIGYQSMMSTTDGSDNVAIGSCSLRTNTTGVRNTAIGSAALKNNTTGTCNVALGYQSLITNTCGSANTAIGSFALCKNTTGFNNVAVGQTALCTNTFGQRNTAIGVQSMKANTVGGCNVAIGYNSLTANTTGQYNTAIGYESLKANTTGHSNTAVGFCALEDNTSGQSNTAVGLCAMCNNTTGYSNTAVGVRASMLNLYGTKNAALGESALQNNTVGGHNVAVGYQALVSSAGGAWNTAVGTCALYTSLNYYNTAVGANAGKLQGTQAAKYNIYLGYNAGCNLTTGAGNVIIGTVQPESNTGNRQLKIAGYDGSSTTTWIKGDSSGNLIVAGTVTANGQLLGAVTKPTVSSISPTVVTNAQTAITITGANFVSIPQVEFLNPSTGIYYLADSVAFSNSTSITVTATLPVDGSYKIRIENGDGEAVLSGSILTVSDTPTFSTAAGSLGTFAGGFSGTIATISASSDSTIAFSETTSVLSGAGVSLNTSTGALTTTDLGGSSTTPTTYNFTLRATDGEGQTADRSFSITTNFGASGGGQFN